MAATMVLGFTRGICGFKTKTLSDYPTERIDKYTDSLVEKLVQVASSALELRRPANLSWTKGRVEFAANRRVLKDGQWTGFGVQADGPVDHEMPILVARNLNGEVKAIVAN